MNLTKTEKWTFFLTEIVRFRVDLRSDNDIYTFGYIYFLDFGANRFSIYRYIHLFTKGFLIKRKLSFTGIYILFEIRANRSRFTSIYVHIY